MVLKEHWLAKLLKELKKTIKATKINEVQGEIDIYESELVKMKTKLESANLLISFLKFF